jgi:NhaP-type Na+/H+ or K+/H+ antiporter
MFRKSLGNIFLLAIPGVIIGAFLLAFVLKSILGYSDLEMTWYQAITLGCALASTDPVAVVTLLK